MKQGYRIAVVYARYSSDNQRDASIDAQLRAIHDYANKNNILIIREYIDRAKSGTTDQRPEFLEMINDSKEKEFEVVLVHKLDRFSRDRYDSAIYKKKLSNQGVKVLSVLEPMLDGSPESIMLESIVEGYSQYYSANLKREVEKGMKENALKCLHNGGQAPLGYGVDPETKKYYIIDEEANIVRRIFDMYINNKGYSEIINSLNSLGAKTKKGQSFGKNSIYGILKNEKYKGVYIFNRSAPKDANNKRNHHKSKDDSEIIKIEGGMPVIIDAITFDQAQELLKKNKHRAGSYLAKKPYLLSGIVECALCGHAMTGSTATGGRNKSSYSYYMCTKKMNKKKCKNKNVRKEYLEEFVLQMILDNLLVEDNVDELIENIKTYQQKKHADSDLEIESLTALLNDNKVKINNIVDSISQGISSPALLKKLNELENETSSLENKLRSETQENIKSKVDRKDLLSAINQFRTNIFKSSENELKTIMRNFVEKVKIYIDHVEVVLKLDHILCVIGGGGGSRTRVR
ncbi:MAG TPA: recombinase family protein, partial [Eubacteriaceae bacterium]|nr:recombinase family protein [Eubacteriaceae bacterium]